MKSFKFRLITIHANEDGHLTEAAVLSSSSTVAPFEQTIICVQAQVTTLNARIPFCFLPRDVQRQRTHVRDE